MHLFDFFTTDLAFCTNGKVKTFFAIKLAMLAVNLAWVLLVSRKVAPRTMGQVDHTVERVLAMSFRDNGGLGSIGTPYLHDTSASKEVVRPCELVRAGYVVAGDPELGVKGQLLPARRVVLSIGHLYWLVVALVVCRLQIHVVRVTVFFVTSSTSLMWSVEDPFFVGVADERLGAVTSARISAIQLE